MKIVATVSDIASAVHCDGAVEKVSAIIEIPEEKIPRIVREYFIDKKRQKEKEIACSYKDISFSLLDEEIE